MFSQNGELRSPTARVGWRVWGTQRISTGFASWLCCCADIAQREINQRQGGHRVGHRPTFEYTYFSYRTVNRPVRRSREGRRRRSKPRRSAAAARRLHFGGGVQRRRTAKGTTVHMRLCSFYTVHRLSCRQASCGHAKTNPL